MAYAQTSPTTKFENAAERGGPGAQFHLGLLYSTGQGVDQDYVIAHKWFNLAALQGSDEARRFRCEIALDMTPQEIACAQRLAREWKHHH